MLQLWLVMRLGEPCCPSLMALPPARTWAAMSTGPRHPTSPDRSMLPPISEPGRHEQARFCDFLGTTHKGGWG